MDAPYLYLTTTGWKSGQAHEIEIWFVPHDGCFYLMSEKFERSHWVQNIRHNPAIAYRVGENTYQGRGRVVDSSAEPALAQAVGDLMAAKYNWNNGLIVELRPVPNQPCQKG